MEKAGSKITFGYDYKLEKDGFGPTAKAGDRNMQSGSLDLSEEHTLADDSTERAPDASKAAGFTIDKTGGVRDGKLFIDNQANRLHRRAASVHRTDKIWRGCLKRLFTFVRSRSLWSS